MTEEEEGWYALRGRYDEDADVIHTRFGEPPVGTELGVFRSTAGTLDIELRATRSGKLVELLVHSATQSLPPAALSGWSGIEYAVLHDGAFWIGFFEGAGAIQRESQRVTMDAVGLTMYLSFNSAGRLVGITVPDGENALEGAPVGLARPTHPGVAFGL
ncbi:hypothetical protein GCM10009740_31250 [Terrabacter terrae]|uniref:Uncharacterized protein n=1 Tax=Terrabacter terrae TaxID=318434 RepID=A0ABN2UJ04_9MICO